MPLMSRISVFVVLLAGIIAAFLYNFYIQPAGLKPAKPTVDLGFNVSKVVEQAKRIASHQRDYGIAAEGLLELYNPELTVFGDEPFPADKVPYADVGKTASLQFVRPHIRPYNEVPMYDNSSGNDPAALGISAILLGQSDPSYMKIAQGQADYLLKTAPRFVNGAVTHRLHPNKLWADSVYTVPPFLAYHAVVSNNKNYIIEAVKQCTLYRDALQAKSIAANKGLWHHAIGVGKEDIGYWSTGNGLAAAGIARVLATIKKWRPTQDMTEQGSLTSYIKEIIDAVMVVDDDRQTGLLRNYLNDVSWFGETSGTALLASVVYRMAVLAPQVFDQRYLDWADEKRKVVARHVDVETGIAAPAVRPLDHLSRDPLMMGSSEGQSFVVLLHAAYRDCVRSGVCQVETVRHRMNFLGWWESRRGNIGWAHYVN